MQPLALLKRASLRLFFWLQGEERIHLVVVLRAWRRGRDILRTLVRTWLAFYPPLLAWAQGDGESLWHRLQWKCSRTPPRVITSSASTDLVWQQIGSVPAVSKMRFIHAGIKGAWWISGDFAFYVLAWWCKRECTIRTSFFSAIINSKLGKMTNNNYKCCYTKVRWNHMSCVCWIVENSKSFAIKII